MKQKHMELIKCLMNQSDPITSAKLVNLLGVSTRTVKTFIKEINESHGQKIILSSKLGYSLSNAYKPVEWVTDSSFPQTQNERAHYIIKTILIEHKPIDVFDLCEELFISYSTLKLNLSQMNKTFRRFKIKFMVKNGRLDVIGSEGSKRKLISYIIFDETNSKFIDLKSLETTFGDDKVKKISSIVKIFFDNSTYHINDFSYVNLILHFLILVERVQLGQYIMNTELANEGLETEESVNRLVTLLEENFAIILSQNEKAQINILIKTYGNYKTPEDKNDIEAIVEPKIMSIVHDVILSVNEVYVIDLYNDNFMPAFYLHIKGLLDRSNYNTYNMNPMLENIKKECRIIYDIAIYISMVLQNRMNITIYEEETAFIALHVGAELERQKQNKQKIRVALLCPNYHNMQEKLYGELNYYFGNEIYINEVASQPSKLMDADFELLISTIETDINTHYETIVIAPFRLEEQKHEIAERIEKIRLNEKKRILKINYKDFFEENLFYINNGFTNKEILLKTVCKDLNRFGYVDDTFESQVIAREKASSTAFGDLALPHSIKMEAVKTCIAVVISKKGIVWDEEKKVSIVLLTTINRIDRSHFTDIYEALISIFDHPSSLHQLKNINSYKEFVEFLKNA